MKKDPYLAREHSKYKNPVASREHILNLIKHKKRLHKTQLFQLLNLKETERHPLSYRLKAMLRDKQISLNHKGELTLFDTNSVEVGRVIAHPKGFGFVALELGGKDLRLSKTQMQFVFHGEIVVVRRLVNSLDARIAHIKERIKTIVGKIVIDKDGHSYLEADDARIFHKILIMNFSKKYKLHQVVVAKIVHYPSFKKVAKVKIISILGDYLAKGLEVETALLRYQIPKEFSEKTQQEAKQIAIQVNAQDKKDRQDLTNLAFITIDGEDSRDFDDAVYAQKMAKNWRLWVCIADVSHYVKPNTCLDKAAMKRANSVYFPSRVIPMLPESLSNGICSLNPLVERLCLACEMIISASGKLSSYKFYPAVIRSNARMTYQEVENILTDVHSTHKNKAIYNNILALSALYKKLLVTRIKRGALVFERTTSKFILDDNDKIKHITKNKPLRSGQIIEECMLLANQSAAQFLDEHKQALLYRVHAQPKVEKLEDTVRLLNSLGINVVKNRLTSTKYLMDILKKAKIQFDENIIQNIILRSMQTAIYSIKNSGHFGLALSQYTHFTSPIRRYPDLLTHRLIKNVLRLKKQRINQSQSMIDKENQSLVRIAQHVSQQERNAEEASRDVEKWLKCEFMSHKLGSIYAGVIAGVSNLGIFVTLSDTLVEGLIPLKTLGRDYFFDNTLFCLMSNTDTKKYCLGNCIKIQVANVYLNTRMIEFSEVQN